MYKISIKEPCQQNWQKMELRQEGRFCAQCSKTVVNFAAMGEDEIIKYLGIQQNVCGRLAETQMDLINNYSGIPQISAGNKWRKWPIAAVSFLWSVLAFKASAQEKIVVQQEQTVSDKQRDAGILKDKSDTIRYLTIKGKITDSLNFAVTGATVTSLPGGKKMITDMNGGFEMLIPATDKQIQVASIGYEVQMINIDNTKQEYKITLKQMPLFLGMITIEDPRSIHH